MKKKYKIAENNGVSIFIDRTPEIGYEPDVALVLLTEALIGAKTFCSHLKDPKEFWMKFRADAEGFINAAEELILETPEAEEVL